MELSNDMFRSCHEYTNGKRTIRVFNPLAAMNQQFNVPPTYLTQDMVNQIHQLRFLIRVSKGGDFAVTITRTPVARQTQVGFPALNHATLTL
jgi:hypothetical protein